MPAASPRRQPERRAEAWFARASSLRLVHDLHRRALPELSRVFGHSGLYLRPSAAVAPGLAGNLLAQVLSLHREGGRLAGDLACEDAALPLASGSLSLVYGLFCLESSPEPEALLSELARVLQPEGCLILLTLNPWAPLRLRWAFRGLRAMPPAHLGQVLGGLGLDLQRRRRIGPVWEGRHALDVHGHREDGLTGGLRAASLWVARRRDPGLTPLRPRAPGLALRPGISPG